MTRDEMQKKLAVHTNQIAAAITMCAERNDGWEIAASRVLMLTFSAHQADFPKYAVSKAFVDGIALGLESILGTENKAGTPLIDGSETVDRNVILALNLITRACPYYKFSLNISESLVSTMTALAKRVYTRKDKALTELAINCFPEDGEIQYVLIHELEKSDLKDGPSQLWSRSLAPRLTGVSMADFLQLDM